MMYKDFSGGGLDKPAKFPAQARWQAWSEEVDRILDVQAPDPSRAESLGTRKTSPSKIVTY